MKYLRNTQILVLPGIASVARRQLLEKREPPMATAHLKSAIMEPYINSAIIKGSIMDPKASRAAAPPHRKGALELDLARVRKRAGVSLDDIVQRTKISSRFLRAIEEEQFDQLPGGIFATSYLRQYALAIGYDEEALVAHYLRKLNPPAPPRKAPPRETGKAGFLDRWLGVAAQSR